MWPLITFTESSASSQLWTLLLKSSHESKGWKKSGLLATFTTEAIFNLALFPQCTSPLNEVSNTHSLRTQVITDLGRKRSPFVRYCNLIGLIHLRYTITVLLSNNARGLSSISESNIAWSDFKISTSYTVRNGNSTSVRGTSAQFLPNQLLGSLWFIANSRCQTQPLIWGSVMSSESFQMVKTLAITFILCLAKAIWLAETVLRPPRSQQTSQYIQPLCKPPLKVPYPHEIASPYLAVCSFPEAISYRL